MSIGKRGSKRAIVCRYIDCSNPQAQDQIFVRQTRLRNKALNQIPGKHRWEAWCVMDRLVGIEGNQLTADLGAAINDNSAETKKSDLKGSK
jgi:hypothetical protein